MSRLHGTTSVAITTDVCFYRFLFMLKLGVGRMASWCLGGLLETKAVISVGTWVTALRACFLPCLFVLRLAGGTNSLGAGRRILSVSKGPAIWVF